MVVERAISDHRRLEAGWHRVTTAERPETALWAARSDGVTLQVSGALDVNTADDVADRLVAEVLGGITQIDLSGVEFCAAAGVRALLAGRETARARGLVLLLRCSPPVVRVLELCGLIELDGWRVVPISRTGGSSREEGNGNAT